MARDPEYNVDFQGSLVSTPSRIFGIEYHDGNLTYENAPCAVCETPRSANIMIPGRRTCPVGWTEEYEGLLVAERYTHQKRDFVCVSLGMETLENGAGRTSGGFWFHTQARCISSMPCPPFSDDEPLSCVVCSK